MFLWILLYLVYLFIVLRINFEILLQFDWTIIFGCCKSSIWFFSCFCIKWEVWYIRAFKKVQVDLKQSWKLVVKTTVMAKITGSHYTFLDVLAHCVHIGMLICTFSFRHECAQVQPHTVDGLSQFCTAYES